MNEELVKFISSLTSEEVDQIIKNLPILTSLLEEPNQPYLLEQILQSQ